MLNLSKISQEIITDHKNTEKVKIITNDFIKTINVLSEILILQHNITLYFKLLL